MRDAHVVQVQGAWNLNQPTAAAAAQVDWLGQRAQIDLAAKHNYKQV